MHMEPALEERPPDTAEAAEERPLVVHVVAADMSAARLDTLRLLLARPDVAGEQRVVHVGPRARRQWNPPNAVCVRAPLPAGLLRARALQRLVDQLADSSSASGRCVIHAWSPAAFDWCAGLCHPDQPLAVDVQAGDDLRLVVRRLASRPITSHAVLLCPTPLVRSRLVGLGVSPESCAIIPETIDAGELSQVDRDELRERLGLTPSQTVVLAVPPISRDAGTFAAVWATLVLEKVRPDIRLVVPADGREHYRIGRLIRSCGQERVTRLAGSDLRPAQLAALADLAVFLPRRDVPLSGLMWAMAAGRPVVASAIPAVAEVLGDGRNARLCGTEGPAEAARLMLELLERPDEARRLANAARTDALSWPDRAAMTGEYARCYANLLRPVPTCPPAPR